jgi:ADP-ribosylglycohydrolase
MALTRRDRAQGALWGLMIADALAMPVHWYYDRAALRRDYGTVRDYLAPRNPHPGSILYRSHYTPRDPDADILHDQARYWGQPGVHYHQHLQPGENTLNLQLVHVLLDLLAEDGTYDPDRYLDRMVAFLRHPGSHHDTYAEEWLRGFFDRRAQGYDLRHCAVEEKHIGGLAGPLALLLFFHDDPDLGRAAAHAHRELTHRGRRMAEALEAVADVLLPVLAGAPVRESLAAARQSGRSPLHAHDLAAWAQRDDLEIIGRRVSPACYVDEAVPAVLYLAWKYADRPEAGLVANTMAGGDNCHRGVVLGALLGAAHGVAGWPERWRDGLRRTPHLPARRLRGRG